MRSLAVALLLLTGCNLYFSDDDDDCKYYAAEDVIAASYRDPLTGECQDFSGPPCDNRCGPCPLYDPAVPDWGSCYTCEGLDEATCIDTPACFASYLDPARVPPDQDITKFQGCWAMAPSGPAPGACSGLDAYECSRHDNCSAIYSEQLGPDDTAAGMTFQRCVPESNGGLCEGIDCQMGSHCEEQCYPCDSPDGNGCPPICQAYCVPDTNSCGNCPPGHECVEVCSTNDPMNPGCGECHVECVPSAQCEALASEADCTARGDCTPVYQGESCTCDASGNCACEILTYDRCETL